VSGAQAGHTVEVIAVDCGVPLVADVVSILDNSGVVPVASPGLAAERLRQTTLKAAAVKPAVKSSK
jgi:hypothetical protein